MSRSFVLLLVSFFLAVLCRTAVWIDVSHDDEPADMVWEQVGEM